MLCDAALICPCQDGIAREFAAADNHLRPAVVGDDAIEFPRFATIRLVLRTQCNPT